MSPVVGIYNFLASHFSESKAYRTINNYRSVISTLYDPVDTLAVSQHPVVCQLLRGARFSCPHYALYPLVGCSTVLDLFRSWMDYDSQSVHQLSAMSTTALCLILFRRISDVCALDANVLSFFPDVFTFRISCCTKSMSTFVSHPSFQCEPALCVVRCFSFALVPGPPFCATPVFVCQTPSPCVLPFPGPMGPLDPHSNRDGSLIGCSLCVWHSGFHGLLSRSHPL